MGKVPVAPVVKLGDREGDDILDLLFSIVEFLCISLSWTVVHLLTPTWQLSFSLDGITAVQQDRVCLLVCTIQSTNVATQYAALFSSLCSGIYEQFDFGGSDGIRTRGINFLSAYKEKLVNRFISM